MRVSLEYSLKEPHACGAIAPQLPVSGEAIHYGVGDPLRLPKTVPPAAFPACFRATHHRCGTYGDAGRPRTRTAPVPDRRCAGRMPAASAAGLLRTCRPARP